MLCDVLMPMSAYTKFNIFARLARWLVSRPQRAISGFMKNIPKLTDAHESEVVQMALSDHVAFSDIEREYGLSDAQVKNLMRKRLKRGSYEAWRKRVRAFGDRREIYK